MQSLFKILFIALVIALIVSLFFGLGWTWMVTVGAFFLGMGMMLYLALASYSDPNYRTNTFQERVGYCGAVVTLFSIVAAIGHVIYWVFF